MKKVMFYCQHTLGMGHFIRSMEIVRGLKDFEVCFLNGGEIVPEFEYPPWVEVVNLPPIKSDPDFKGIQSVGGQSLDELREQRTRHLLSEFERFKPDLVIIELFPFGRKKFASELVPLLARIRLSGGPAKVVCSLRDILVSKSYQARHEEWVCTVMNRYFDMLLVHADPRFQRLEETFSRVNDIKTEIRYTGYVAQSPQPHPGVLDDDGFHASGTDELLILVSIGGGRVGYELLACTAEASAIIGGSPPHRLMIFTGPYLPEEQFLQLQGMTEHRPNITLQRFTTRFLSYMQRADLSISMAGYNTCMNILTTGVRSLVLPFTGGHDEEQTIRAQKLQQHGVVTIIQPYELHPDRLAKIMAEALSAKPTPGRTTFDTHGSEKTATFLQELVNRRDSAGRSDLEISHGGNHWGGNHAPWQVELRKYLDTLQAAQKEIRIFCRDDDIDEDEETLRRLLDITLSRGVPLNLEIIPGKLTDPTITLLKNHIRVNSDLVVLNQHGWMHVNHEKEGRKCEFGVSRGFYAQFEDIARGKALLEEIFGDRFYPTFIPPWNRCTEDTFKVLDQLCFQVLSRDQGEQPVTGYKFQEISITLDLYRWKGGVTMRPSQEIVTELISQISERDTVGILLHHKVMEASAFSFLDLLLGELSHHSIVRFHTFQSLQKSTT